MLLAVRATVNGRKAVAYVKNGKLQAYDLTPQGIIQRLGLLDMDYNKVSAYGHFGKPSLPWEE